MNHPDKAGITHGQLIFDNHLPEEENEGARRLYQGEIDDTMSEVGRLLEELKRSGYSDDTIVVFTPPTTATPWGTMTTTFITGRFCTRARCESR